MARHALLIHALVLFGIAMTANAQQAPGPADRVINTGNTPPYALCQGFFCCPSLNRAASTQTYLSLQLSSLAPFGPRSARHYRRIRVLESSLQQRSAPLSVR